MTPLAPWMRFTLRFAGTYNILAGLSMLLFYHEGFKLLGLPKPGLIILIQLVGVLVGLFGVGYHLVASRPWDNRNLLLLGWWSKALGSALGIFHVARGALPLGFLAILFFSDIIYLPPLAVIYRAIKKQGARGVG